jgi:hypothetical protein
LPDLDQVRKNLVEVAESITPHGAGLIRRVAYIATVENVLYKGRDLFRDAGQAQGVGSEARPASRTAQPHRNSNDSHVVL